MIEAIHQRLLMWAQWSVARMDGMPWHIGQYRYQERTSSGFVDGGMSPTKSDCLLTEAAVGWLKVSNPRVADAVLLTYRDAPHYSCAMRAEALRVSKRTLHRYVDLGHTAIQDYLRDRARGVVPQMALLKRMRRG